MKMVLLTALGVGGATVFGSLLGFVFKKISHKFSDIVLAFAAGVMLCAAVTGLILPSLEYESFSPVVMTVSGVFAGALFLNVLDKLVPHLHRLAGIDREQHPDNAKKLNKVLLFVMAIGIHNLPEGIAAGVGFGSGNHTQAITIAAGIALQNIPERICTSSRRSSSRRASGSRHPRERDARPRSVGNYSGILRSEPFFGDFALCPCLCRRHNALCNQRRNDS